MTEWYICVEWGVGMLLSKIDKIILELLKENREGLSATPISKRLHRLPSQIQKRLKRMQIHGIVERINSHPVIYKIKISQRHHMTFFVVRCPKCNQERRVHYTHTTAVCSNPNCRTPSGTRTRFWITDNRIIRAEHIL